MYPAMHLSHCNAIRNVFLFVSRSVVNRKMQWTAGDELQFVGQFRFRERFAENYPDPDLRQNGKTDVLFEFSLCTVLFTGDG
jgi:hypothetical protein